MEELWPDGGSSRKPRQGSLREADPVPLDLHLDYSLLLPITLATVLALQKKNLHLWSVTKSAKNRKNDSQKQKYETIQQLLGRYVFTQWVCIIGEAFLSEKS